LQRSIPRRARRDDLEHRLGLSASADTDTSNNSASATTTVNRQSDLSITKLIRRIGGGG